MRAVSGMTQEQDYFHAAGCQPYCSSNFAFFLEVTLSKSDGSALSAVSKWSRLTGNPAAAMHAELMRRSMLTPERPTVASTRHPRSYDESW